ncbi:MAG: hypothetical protein WKF57_06575 [Nakamurella sp.]
MSEGALSEGARSDVLLRCCRCCADDDPEFHAENGIDAHEVSCPNCHPEQEEVLLDELAAKDAEIARLRAELAARDAAAAVSAAAVSADDEPGQVIGYMLYADSPFEESHFVGQSLTDSVLADTKILDPALAGWLKVNPTARIVAVAEMLETHLSTAP